MVRKGLEACELNISYTEFHIFNQKCYYYEYITLVWVTWSAGRRTAIYEHKCLLTIGTDSYVVPYGFMLSEDESIWSTHMMLEKQIVYCK
jgi:hypothetical protein